MLNIPLSIIEAFMLFIPGFVANPAAVITGGRYPMDGGHKFIDGKRIFGDGKTWSGYFGGSLLGVLSGLILTGIFLISGTSAYFSYGGNILSILVALFAMSFGSLTGYVTVSFIKRRMGLRRGERVSLLDQCPFVMVSSLFLLLFAGPFSMTYYGNIMGALPLLIITPPLHRVVNIIGYRMKKKDVPW